MVCESCCGFSSDGPRKPVSQLQEPGWDCLLYYIILFYLGSLHFLSPLRQGFMHSHAHPRLTLYLMITLTFYDNLNLLIFRFQHLKCWGCKLLYGVLVCSYSPLLCSWCCKLTLCLFAVPPPVHSARWGIGDWGLSPESFVVGAGLNPHRSELMGKSTETEMAHVALSSDTHFTKVA